MACSHCCRRPFPFFILLNIARTTVIDTFALRLARTRRIGFPLDEAAEVEADGDESVIFSSTSGSVYNPSDLSTTVGDNSSLTERMFSTRDSEDLQFSEQQVAAEGEEVPEETRQKEEAAPPGEKLSDKRQQKQDTEKAAGEDNVPEGYKVIIPSPSKRMEVLRAKQKEEESSAAKNKPPTKPKTSKANYRNEMTGADQDKIAEYLWPDKPTEWSTVEDSENPEEKIVNGQKVSRPMECHRVEVDGELTDTWALKPNLLTKGRCGVGKAERDWQRYGEYGKFEEGDFLLVPDGKRNQLYDGGWFTGEERELPKPYGRSLLLEWADTSNYRGSKMDTEAWRAVFVPVSRLIKAPVRKRSFEHNKKKRGSSNKFTFTQISKMSLGSEVVYKDNAPFCLFARNPRESCIWVRPICGGETLGGDDDDLCCFYLEDLDAYTPFTTKMAQQIKAVMQKICTARQRKDRRKEKELQRTSVDARLTQQLTAPSFTSSPAVSERSNIQISGGGISSTPVGVATPNSLVAPSIGMQNLGPLLEATASQFAAYGLTRTEPFTETEFWKQEANTFLSDSKQSFQGLAKIQVQVEQSIQTLCDLNEHVRIGVKSQIELMQKNQALADQNALTVSQLTALSETIAKLMGGRLQTTAQPMPVVQHNLPDTVTYLGKAATETMTASHQMTYRSTVHSLQGIGVLGACSTDLNGDSPAAKANGKNSPKLTKEQATESKTQDPKTPKERKSTVSTTTPASAKPKAKTITPSPDSEVLGVQKTTYKPTRPKGPWSGIDQNSLFFKLDEDWIRSRRLACLRLGRPIKPHEMGAVKWLAWRDSKFDAFAELKEPEEFSKVLAMVNYVEAKGNGTGLNDKVIGNFVKGYKEGGTKRFSGATKVTASQSTTSRSFNKAQLKQLASASVHEKKEKKQKVEGSVKKKRGMKKGTKRRAADPKLKEVWPGIDTAASYNPNLKRMWGKKHIDAAKRTVANLKDRSRVQKLYRFVERLLKQMLDEKRLLKHASISLRNALRKLSGSGWQLQEEEVKKYHFYWAAVELYKDNYKNEWPTGAQRDSYQLKVAEKIAGIAKSWEVLVAEPAAKKTKLEETEPMPVDVSIDDEDDRKKAIATPEVNLQAPNPDATERTKVPNPEPLQIDDNSGDLIIAAGDDDDDDFTANVPSPKHKPEQENEEMDTEDVVVKEPEIQSEVDESLLLSMQDDNEDLRQQEEEELEKGNGEEFEDEQEESDDGSVPGAGIRTDQSESGSESDDEDEGDN